MENTTIITIARHTYSRALLLKVELEEQGIVCFLTNIDDPSQDVEIRIREEDAMAAMEIIEANENAFGVDKEISIQTLRSVRRILVPVDFSPLSFKAANYALELSKTLKADIRLVNVWYSNANEPFAFNEMYSYHPDFEILAKEQQTDAQQRIEQMCSALNYRIKNEKLRGVGVDFDLIRGNAVEGILGVIEDYQPGLVVMGTHGKKRSASSFIGSTTAQLIQQTKVPILTIPLGLDTDHFRTPRHVMFATNFDASDFNSIHKLIAFSRPFNLKIYCVHVHLGDSINLDEGRMMKLRNHLKQEYHEFDIECGLIESEDVLTGIQDFIHEKEIDVISLTSHKRNLISKLIQPSLTKKILFQSEIPMLVFKA
jgi:nucleotide-binding universal stress UspA family protein